MERETRFELATFCLGTARPVRRALRKPNWRSELNDFSLPPACGRGKGSQHDHEAASIEGEFAEDHGQKPRIRCNHLSRSRSEPPSCQRSAVEPGATEATSPYPDRCRAPGSAATRRPVGRCLDIAGWRSARKLPIPGPVDSPRRRTRRHTDWSGAAWAGLKVDASSQDRDHLRSVARAVRVEILRAVAHAGAGHLSGPLSAVEILTALYFDAMSFDPLDAWPTARCPRWAGLRFRSTAQGCATGRGDRGSRRGRRDARIDSVRA